jgi:hypothetical protein
MKMRVLFLSGIIFLVLHSVVFAKALQLKQIEEITWEYGIHGVVAEAHFWKGCAEEIVGLAITPINSMRLEENLFLVRTYVSSTGDSCSAPDERVSTTATISPAKSGTYTFLPVQPDEDEVAVVEVTVEFATAQDGKGRDILNNRVPNTIRQSNRFPSQYLHTQIEQGPGTLVGQYDFEALDIDVVRLCKGLAKALNGFGYLHNCHARKVDK